MAKKAKTICTIWPFLQENMYFNGPHLKPLAECDLSLGLGLRKGTEGIKDRVAPLRASSKEETPSLTSMRTGNKVKSRMCVWVCV